jgi:hypothetical protein
MLEDASGAKKTRCERLSLVSGVHLPPQVEHTSRFIPGAAHLLPSRFSVLFRRTLSSRTFVARQNASAAGVEVQELGG